MKVVIFQCHPLDMLPPLISIMRILRVLNVDIYYVGITKTDTAVKALMELGVDYSLYGWSIVSFREHPFIRLWQKLTAFVRPFLFRRWAWKEIGNVANDCDNVVLWTQSMNSASILGNRALIFGNRHIVSLYDLGDEYGKDLCGFDMARLYESATLVECEYNRAHILMAEKRLGRIPFVLPNKPYGHPRLRNLQIEDCTVEDIVRSWGNRKVFLYQGALASDRGELLDVLEWLCDSFPDLVVAVMGNKNAIVDKLSARHSNFSYVPFVAPPHHLEVTSHAHIGIAIYKGTAAHGLSPLNAVYCAPNKIFEYSGFGMPMLCNDIPGLRYTVGESDAGICVETINRESVVAAARMLIDKYEEYSKNAIAFFESVDTVQIVKDILDFGGRK